MFGDIFSSAGEDYTEGNADYRGLLDDATGRSKGLFESGTQRLGSSNAYLSGAANALNDLRSFYRPFMFEGQTAIDRYLPSRRRTQEMLAPELGEISQGFESAQDNIAKFAPRGGGRISTMAKGRLDMGNQLASTFFKGRESLRNSALQSAFQAASGEGSRANSLRDLGLGIGQLGLGEIGAGNQTLSTGGGLAMNAKSNALNSLGMRLGAAGGIKDLATTGLGLGLQGGNNATSLYNSQANRAYGGGPQGGGGGRELGGYLVDLFSNKGVQDKLGGIFGGLFGGNKNNILPGTDFNYGYFG